MRCVRRLLVALGLLLALSAPGTALAQNDPPPELVLEELEAALNAGRVDQAVELFTTDAQIRVDSDFRGRAGVRRWIREQVQPGTHLHFGNYDVSGERATLTVEVGQGEWWRHGGPAQTLRARAFVRGGQIRSLSLSGGTFTSLAASAASDGDSDTPISIWAGIAFATLALAATLLRRRAAGSPPLRPAQQAGLVAQLGAWAASRRQQT